MVGKAQDKIGIGNVPDGADSVGIGSNTVWVKPSSFDPNAFVMRISVTANQKITIPFYNTTGYNGVINWKDGTTSTITAYNDADRVHTYATAGDYDIEFSGTFKGFYFNNTGDKAIVKQIIQWGNIGMTSTANAFYGCSNLFDLGDLGNSSSITSLGNYCFFNCTSLSSIIIPSSITSLGNYCFYGCRYMLSYYVNPTTPPTLGPSALTGATGWKIYVPSASVTAYKAASGWSSYASRIFAQ